MRRFARRLVTLCSAVSLLLFVAVCGLWVQSYRTEVGGHTGHDVGQTEVAFQSRLGCTYFGVTPRSSIAWHGYVYESSIDATYSRAVSLAQHHGSHAWFGFALMSKDFMPPTEWRQDPRKKELLMRLAPYLPERTYGVIVPHWFLAAMLGVLPLRWLAVAVIRRTRSRVGHCPACGYDLRASPERCPECGAETPK